MSGMNDVLSQDLSLLDHQKLLDVAKSLRDSHHDSLCKNAKQQEELKQLQQRILSFPSSTSSSSTERRKSWIRAELDYPDDTYLSCSGKQNKYPLVIVYDRRNESSPLAVRSTESLKNEHSVIYSRLPSRMASEVHVFIEIGIFVYGSNRKYRISTRKAAPADDWMYDCSIHLKRLGWNDRVKLWTGGIKWLYILSASEKTS
ncbi:hypothetical protein B0O99DRAFT_90231 [Bisporella sp. PMI_857]|nr:hypothetical protein B0O99DRAFT_90231 [Bisporella sp. PMI_857]